MSAVTFSVWGDSHTDDVPRGASIAGIGARKAIEYELHTNHDVKMLGNWSVGGSQVKDWINDWAKQQTPNVLVVSSGTNEAAALDMGGTTIQEVTNYWRFLIWAATTLGSKVLWVPCQSMWGIPATFKHTQELRELPATLGADVLDWYPAEEDMFSDRVHYTWEASHMLAMTILEKVASYGESAAKT